jgi:hypothetical protein
MGQPFADAKKVGAARNARSLIHRSAVGAELATHVLLIRSLVLGVR